MKKLAAALTATLVFLTLTGCARRESADKASYNITAEYFDNGVISARMTISYTPGGSGTDKLAFNLPANAFRDGAKITPLPDDADSFGGMEILSVNSGGAPLEYALGGTDENVLYVTLPEYLEVGKTAEVEIVFAVALAGGSYRLSKGENTVNVGNWYPALAVRKNGEFVECEYGKIGDPFFNAACDYEVSLTVPGSLVVAGSGEAVSCDVGEGKTSYSYKLSRARDFAFCMSDKFEVMSQKSGNRTINYYYFSDEHPENTFRAVECAMNYFSEKFGEYPYSSFSICEADFEAGGMEYSALAIVNAAENEKNRIYAAVHETAHQWWYGLVGNDQLNEAYLDEGLAEYSTAVFFCENDDFGVSGDVIFENAETASKAYAEIMSAIGKTPNPKLNRNLADFSGEYEYACIAYDRALTMFRAAEEAIGRKKILSLLNGYCREYSFRIADGDCLLRSLKPAAPILRSYIEGKAG